MWYISQWIGSDTPAVERSDEGLNDMDGHTALSMVNELAGSRR